MFIPVEKINLSVVVLLRQVEWISGQAEIIEESENVDAQFELIFDLI